MDKSEFAHVTWHEVSERGVLHAVTEPGERNSLCYRLCIRKPVDDPKRLKCSRCMRKLKNARA